MPRPAIISTVIVLLNAGHEATVNTLGNGDMTETRIADLLEVEQGEAFREQLAVDDAFAQPRDYPKADAPRQLVERCPDSLQIV